MKKCILPFLLFLTSIGLVNAQNYHVNEDFNAAALPAGWSNNALSQTQTWSFGIDGVSLQSQNQNLDGTPFAYFDDDALGATSPNNHVELITPSFDNSTSPKTTLEFDYNFRQFASISDSFYVEVFDGSNWVLVFTETMDNCGNYIGPACANGFPHAVIDLSPYNNANCQVRFRYFDGNDPADWGWYVGFDNVQIYSPFPNDVRVSNLIQPESGCGLGSAMTVEVRVKNVGSTPASNFDVELDIDGTVVATETVNSTIAPEDSISYQFTATANLSAIGAYTIKAYTQLSGDGNLVNDTTTTIVNNEPNFVPTYTNDFETSPDEWTVSGQLASWQKGAPTRSPINFAASGTQAWVTNLTGAYNNNELSYLTSPCFDFSASIGDPIMSFNLFYDTEFTYDFAWMEYSTDNGVSWSRLTAAANASNWYNYTTPTATNPDVWSGNSNAWLSVENILTGLAGEPQVKLRMVFDSDAGTLRQGVGFDNFAIRNPQAFDLSVNSILYPVGSGSFCGYSQNENVIIQIENKGANTLSGFDVSYQVNNGGIITETINFNLQPNTRFNYVFNTKFDFSGIQTYTINAWGTATGDGFNQNDSIFNVQASNTQTRPAAPLPYLEDFNSFTPGNGFSNNGDALANNWTRTPANGWKVSNGTLGNHSSGTAADQDCTPGLGGNYLYLEVSSVGTGVSAFLESPCLDLTNASGAKMEYCYHKYGNNMGDLYVDIETGNGWVTVDSVLGQTHFSSGDSWSSRQVTINQFAGRRFRVRFRGESLGCCAGDMGIDDFFIYEPIAKDAKIIGPVSPTAGCSIGDSSIVAVEIFNEGTQNITADSMYVYYQIDNLAPVKDTFDGLIASEQSSIFTFTQLADLSVKGKRYNIKTWVELIGDNNQLNDTSQYYRVTNDTRAPSFVENMESFRDASCSATLGQVLDNGWTVEPGPYMWHVQRSTCGQANRVTPNPNSGPNGDHTTAPGNGIFMYTDTDPNITNGGSNARLLSHCIDLTNSTNPVLSFWYHKYGSSMGNLTVQGSDGGSWVNLASINGQTQNSSSDPWKLQTVNLTNYTGDLMQVRFVGTNGGANSDMALDDIFVYEANNIDVGVSEITSPTGDGCGISGSYPLTVKVNNFGLQAIAPNSVELRYTNNKRDLTIDTLPQGIPVGSSVTYTFANNVQVRFGEQILRVEANLSGDTVKGNDALESLVINRKAGLPFYYQNFERFVKDPGGAPPYAGDDLKDWTRVPDPVTSHGWHVWSGNAPTIGGEPMPPPPIPANGPSGDHTFATDIKNGDGLYMLTETKLRDNPNITNTRPDAELYFPCGNVDLSNSKNGRVLLSFWYHKHGQHQGDLFIDVFDGSQWINGAGGNLRGPVQANGTDQWQEFYTSLDSFANNPNVQIRLRADYIMGGNGAGGGDIGIDDIRLIDRENRDMWVKDIVDPVSDCDMGARERIRVRAQNLGVNDILQSILAYQITYTSFDEVVTQYPIQRDTFVAAQIVPLGQYVFTFTDRADFTQSGSYEVKVWSELNGDQNVFNDTIVEVIENITRPFPSCEDFSSLLVGDKGPDFTEELFPNNWTSSRDSAYVWKAALQGPDGSGAAFPGHTSGVNDLYMYLADGMQPGQQAWIQTPCIDLRSIPAANLQFFYQAGHPNHELYVQARRGAGGWTDIDTLRGFGLNTVTSWTKVELVLDNFVGDFVEFRFLGVFQGAYYALDDICVISPPPQQIELEQIFRPRQGLCWYGDEETITLRVQNVGKDRIDSLQVQLMVDRGVPKIPRGQFQRDTLMIYPTNPTLDPGVKLDLNLDSTVDMSAYDQYYISARVIVPGDIDTGNNVILNKPYTHPDPIDLPYIVDFEDPNDPLQRLQPFILGPAPGYHWMIKNGEDRPGSNTTGPAYDHTFQSLNGPGNYIVSQSDAPMAEFGDAIVLGSECLDFESAQSPEMSYWYHMFSAADQMGNLFLQINDDFGWVTLDSLKGADPDQQDKFDPWKKRTVNLSVYAGDVVRYRFVSVRGNSTFSNMGLDDISVYDVPPSDAAAVGVIYPNEDSTSCYTDTQTVRVHVRNNGADSIDFRIDTMDVEVRINRDGVPWDTLTTQVNSDIWFPGNVFNGNYYSLPPDSVATVILDGSFDMSQIGSVFEFTTELNFYPDLIASNDSIKDTVRARRETGRITQIVPNDTVCHGTQVRLLLEDYFGALKWQEKELDRNGNGFYFDGFAFPNDQRIYVRALDTTTELRVEVCRVEQSAPVTVEITKPYQGKPINGQACAQGSPGVTTGAIPVDIGIETPDNITKVRLFYPNDTTLIDSIMVPSTTLSNGNLQWDFKTDSLIPATGYDTIYGVDTTGGLVGFDTTLAPVFIDSIHTFYAATVIDSCETATKLPIQAVVSRVPSRTKFPSLLTKDGAPGDYDSTFVCQDSSIVLNAGGEEGRVWEYDWTLTFPDGRIETDSLDSLQTVVVDAWLLEKNKTYKYEVQVKSDSGCQATQPIGIYVTVQDSCVTNIKEYRFGDEFSIYPNPTNDDLYIDYQSLTNLEGRVSLISMQGKLIEERLNVDFRRGRTKFNLGDLPKGIYFIRIKTDQGTIVRKVVRS
ncbi:MAG: choice-of-anchor J domain-containing protein [Vicingaceae bacterium]